MDRRRLADFGIAVLVVCACLVLAHLQKDEKPVANGLFLSILVLGFLLAARHVVRSAGRWREASSRAREVARLSPYEAARAAVAEERVRLAADIQAVVRASVHRMGELAEAAADAWDTGPAPALVQIQEEGRRATSELRRLLGLLRESAVVRPAPPQADPPPGQPEIALLWGVPRNDVLRGTAAVLIAAVEIVVYQAEFADVVAPSLTAAALTLVAAAMITGRRLAAGPCTVACAALVGASAMVGHPVTDGLWRIVTFGGLAWACASLERRVLWAVAGPVLLGVAATYELVNHSPENLGINLVIIGVGVLGGAMMRTTRSRAEAAREAAARAQLELDAAAEEAVQAERRAVARELHDLVSGAVGVIVMQAGAAELQLPTDPRSARRALDNITATCAATLVELDRMLPVLGGGAFGARIGDWGAVGHGMDDITALVERLRLAGLSVDLVMSGTDHVEAGTAVSTAYRIIQESLTNVLRHARGAHAVVRLERTERGLSVDVSDDGPGRGAETRTGYGLVGLMERVQAAGGTFSCGPAVGATGVRVHADLPVRTTVTAS